MISLIFRIFLAIQMAVTPALAQNARANDQALVNQFIIQRGLVKTGAKLEKIKSGKDLAFSKAFELSQKDRQYILEKLGANAKIPKVTLLNSGFRFVYNKSVNTVLVKDLNQRSFTINGKVWKHNPAKPLQPQVEGFVKQFKSAGLGNPLWSEAYALDPITLIASALISLSIGFIFASSAGVLSPIIEEWYCKDKDMNEYRYYKTCGEYFKFQKDIKRPKIDKAPVTEEGNAVPPIKQNPPKCPTPSDLTFVSEIEITGTDKSKNIVRTTVTYDKEDLKPKEIKQEVFANNETSTVYMVLNSAGQLNEVLDEKRTVVLSRDPNKKELMNPAKFARMEKFDDDIKLLKAGLEFCEKGTKAKLDAASKKPEALLSQEVVAPKGGSQSTQ